MGNAVASNTALNLLAGNGSRSDPVALATYAPLSASALSAVTTIDVPAGAVRAQFVFAYTAAAGSTAGQAAHSNYVHIGAIDYLSYYPDAATLVTGVTAVASATSRYTGPIFDVGGYSKIGIAALEVGDSSGHPGGLVVQVVWIS